MFLNLLLRLHFRINLLMLHLTCEAWLCFFSFFFKDHIKYQFDKRKAKCFFRVISSQVVLNNVDINSCTIEFFIVRKWLVSIILHVYHQVSDHRLSGRLRRANEHVYDSRIAHIYAAINIINRRVVLSHRSYLLINTH